jgi:hypothetical protein
VKRCECESEKREECLRENNGKEERRKKREETTRQAPNTQNQLKTTPDSIGEHIRRKCVCVCLCIGMWRGAVRASRQKEQQPTNQQTIVFCQQRTEHKKK